jgi:hypothetical protein
MQAERRAEKLSTREPDPVSTGVGIAWNFQQK